MKPPGPGLLFVGRFWITVSISLLVNSLFIFSVHVSESSLQKKLILYFSTYQINKGTVHKTSRIRYTINNPKFHSSSTDRINFGFSVSSLPAFFPSMHLQHLNWDMRKESETTSIFIRTLQYFYRVLWYTLWCFISHSWEAVHAILFFLMWNYFILKMNDRKATFRLKSSWKTRVWKWKWSRSVVSDSLRPHGL